MLPAAQEQGVANVLVSGSLQPGAPAMPAGASEYFSSGAAPCVAPGGPPVYRMQPTVLGQAPAFYDPSGRPVFAALTEFEARTLIAAQALRAEVEAPGKALAAAAAATAAREAERAAHVDEARQMVRIQWLQKQYAEHEAIAPDARLPIAPLPAEAAAAGAADPLSFVPAYGGQRAFARTADGRDLFKSKPGPGF